MMKPQHKSIVALVVVNNPWFRQTVGQILTAQSLSFCIKEVKTPEELLANIEQHSDIVIIDPFTFEKPNLSLIRHIKQVSPQLPVVTLLPSDSQNYHVAAMQAGADAVVVKDKLNTDLYPVVKGALKNRQRGQSGIARLKQVQRRILPKREQEGMNENSLFEKTQTGATLARRSFLKWSAALGGSAALAGGIHFNPEDGLQMAPQAAAAADAKVIRVGCPAHNCGGRCVLRATVEDGVITRIETDDRPNDTIAMPQLRACPRGRSYRRRQYHPDRLKYPMKRVGERGSGEFERITWDEALDIVAGQIQRVKDTYGNDAIFVHPGTGSYMNTNGSHLGGRLMNLLGGSLGSYGNYSWAAIYVGTTYVYGTMLTGNQRQDWMNTKYILMWGWNPGEMRDGSGTELILRRARENGAKVVCIDPILTKSAVGMADEWIPIRPGTDVAMMSAMAYVMITEGLYDAEFVQKYCSGFDSSQMPEGAEGEESYMDYIMGTNDGVPKTPEWAEAITTVPAAKIAEVARDYATYKPAMLYQGYGMQRRAYGEQVVRAGCVLPALTGNVGIPGGWASGIAFQAPDWGPLWTVIPSGTNSVEASIPVFLWTEAVARGTEMGPEDGLVGADKLNNNIKLIYAIASNLLVDQHANINRTVELLKDESKVEFIISQDHFMTASAKFADIILPASTAFEVYGIEDGWKYGDEVILMPQLVEPAFETKSDYQICADIAAKMGVGDEYTEGGRTERDWVAWIVEQYQASRFPECPSLDEFEASNIGVYAVPVDEPAVAFADFRADPEANPLDTPTGKIEIFSKGLYDMGNPDEIPALPKYIQEWESPFGPEAEAYPLQAMGLRTWHRVHTTHDNVDWLEEAFPQRAFMNPIDAEARGIKDGQDVQIYNERGTTILPVRITKRIMPGVVNIPEGGWWTPDENGVDRRGSANVLTSERWTPVAYGTAQHTFMVEVEKA